MAVIPPSGKRSTRRFSPSTERKPPGNPGSVLAVTRLDCCIAVLGAQTEWLIRRQIMHLVLQTDCHMSICSSSGSPFPSCRLGGVNCGERTLCRSVARAVITGFRVDVNPAKVFLTLHLRACQTFEAFACGMEPRNCSRPSEQGSASESRGRQYPWPQALARPAPRQERSSFSLHPAPVGSTVFSAGSTPF